MINSWLKIEEISKLNLQLGLGMGGDKIKVTVEDGLIFLNGTVVEKYSPHVSYRVNQACIVADRDEADDEDYYPSVRVGGYNLFIMDE